MRKTLSIVTALVLGTTVAGCKKAETPADTNITAENVVVDAADANAVDANAVDANAVDANAVDANAAVDGGNNVTVHGSTDH